jgi:hypothetical protein
MSGIKALDIMGVEPDNTQKFWGLHRGKVSPAGWHFAFPFEGIGNAPHSWRVLGITMGIDLQHSLGR